MRAQGVSASQDLPPLQGSSLAQPPALDLAALHQLARPLDVTVQVAQDQVEITLPGA